MNFTGFLNLSVNICERLFNALKDSNENFLSVEKFSNGLSNLYFGDYHCAFQPHWCAHYDDSRQEKKSKNTIQSRQ